MLYSCNLIGEHLAAHIDLATLRANLMHGAAHYQFLTIQSFGLGGQKLDVPFPRPQIVQEVAGLKSYPVFYPERHGQE
jgi:hypothetical protein